MTDPSTTQQSAGDPAVERPTWRFSGRRGTPVHLREQTPATLPPEIRQAIVQLARERSGEASTPTGGTSVRTMAGPNLSGARRQSPPVAGAPLPVERRSRERTSEPVVTTSPIGPALAPEPTPQLEVMHNAEATDVADATPPLIEAEAMPDSTGTPHDATDPDAAETADAAPTAMPATATPAKWQARRRDGSKLKARTLAKARAKTRAKAQRHADADATPKRNVLAADRIVEPAEAAIELPELTAVDPVTTTLAPEPAAPEPVAVDTMLDPADVVPIAETAVWTTTITSDEPAADGAWDGPSPSVAADAASQAAWELGRLPILMTPSSLDAVADADADADAYLASTIEETEPDLAPAWETVVAPASTIEPPFERTTEPESETSPEPARAPEPEVANVPEPTRMAPMRWRTQPDDPAPVPIEPLDLPQRSTPATIARLRQPLLASDEQPWASGARVWEEDAAPSIRSAASRRHVDDRRRDLELVLAQLAAIGSTPPRP